MNRIVISFLIFMAAFVGRAQELTIVSMEPTMEVLTADKQRTDLNGNVCAVVYVQTPESGLEFEGNIIGDVQFKSSQYKVYLSAGTKSLKILGNSFFPKTVRFADYGIDALEAKRVYAMQITVPGNRGGGSVDLGENYVSFTVTPGNAVIVIDGGDPEAFNNGEWRKRLPYGQYSYRITAPGFKPESGSFTVAKGDPTQKSVTLQSLMAQLSVKCLTTEAQIYINDEKQGTGSYTGVLPAGNYVVEARHPSYVTYSELVTLEESGSKTINIPALTALTGTLDIDYSPTGATIQIDGADYGTSPRLVYDLPVGTHSITLAKDGYEPITLTAVVNEKEITTLTGSLNKKSSFEELYELGEKYYKEKNYTKAVECFQQAADKGYAPAQCQLGFCYQFGNGVEEDETKAVEWYRKAANQGYARAQNNLGSCYNYGNGVEIDKSKAVDWYRKAADQGYVVAQYCLGGCYFSGNGVEKDYLKAVEWYRKAADQGDALAQDMLGYCYEKGYGVEKDISKAVEWYKKAADQDWISAKQSLKELQKN